MVASAILEFGKDHGAILLENRYVFFDTDQPRRHVID
jgi:hypothetical protein